MKITKNKQIVFVITITLMSLMFFLIWDSYLDIKLPVLKDKDKLNGIIIKIESGDYTGMSCYTFNSGLRINMGGDLYENTREEGMNRYLSFFLQIGDSIYKKENSDSIFVYRGNREYIFISTYNNEK